MNYSLHMSLRLTSFDCCPDNFQEFRLVSSAPGYSLGSNLHDAVVVGGVGECQPTAQELIRQT